MKILKNLFMIVLVMSSGILTAQDTGKMLVATDVEYSLSTSVNPITLTPVSYEKELTNKEFGKEYFPFDTKKVYHFESNVGDTEAEFTRFEDGVTLTYDAPNMEYRQTLVNESDGIFLKRTEMKAFLFFGNDIKYVEPVLRIPFPMKAGDSWEWHALETEDGDTTNLTISGEVLGEEKVFTPYGEFNCLKIRQHITSEKGSTNIMTEWFAPRVGLVKSHTQLEGSGLTGFIQSVFGYDEVTFELASVEVKKDE